MEYDVHLKSDHSFAYKLIPKINYGLAYVPRPAAFILQKFNEMLKKTGKLI